MDAQSGSWVPKVHPLSRSVEAEDPMELVATPMVGDPDVMLEAFVQEFAQLGLGAEELYRMFRNPAYPVLRQLGDCLGEAELPRRIEESLARTGVFRVRETILEPEDNQDEHEGLVQLTVRRRTAQARGPDEGPIPRPRGEERV